MRRLRSVVLLSVLVLADPESAASQAGVTARDSLTQQGSRDGVAAANASLTGGRALAGFLGGASAVFFAPFSPRLVIAGAGISVAAFTVGSADPNHQTQTTIDLRGPLYASAFRESFARRLTTRRRTAALVGTGVGAGVGLGALLLLIAAFSDIS